MSSTRAKKATHESIISYKRGRYGLWMFYLVLASLLVYLTHGDLQPPSGGTWQGYTLGTIGALIIVWLILLGVRKRSYHSSMGSVQGWTSAHVYAGIALLFIATLHSGFQFGLNIHTFAYVLMVIVILSGIAGLWLYMRYPALMTESLGGSDYQVLAEELEDSEKEILRISQHCDSDVRVVVLSAVERTILPRRFWDRLLARDRSTLQMRAIDDKEASTVTKVKKNKNQVALINFLASRIPFSAREGEVNSLQQLLSVCAHRKQVLARMRRYLQIKTFLKVWLWFHIPVSMALLAALFAHIFAVFYYW